MISLSSLGLLNEPALRHIGGGRWVLLEPHRFEFDGFSVGVPAGYIYDLASIPRPLGALLARYDLSTAAPLLHDFLYGWCGVPPSETVTPPTRTFTRAEVDRLFLETMERCGVGVVARRVAYLAVRTFGWLVWRRHYADLQAEAT